MLKMDRAGFAVLMLLTVALVQIGDSERDITGGRKLGAGADRAVWDQQQSLERSQGPKDSASSGPSAETSPRSLVRVPRGTSSHVSAAGPPHVAGSSREELVSAPRDGALRTARHPASQQHRTKVNRRQGSKPGSTSTRRLAG